MNISLVAAASENWVVGKDDGLPWHHPGDLRHFRELTMGHPVIMGRKTHESIGKPLRGRTNIVMSGSMNPDTSTAYVAEDAKMALRIVRALGADKVMVIGGGEIYKSFLPLASTIHLTIIHEQVEGDTVFPTISPSVWDEVGRIEPNPRYSFVTYRRSTES